MARYSSAQFYHDWRYSIEKEFANPSGEPVTYAHDGLRTWGGERHRIPFPKPPAKACVNFDGSLLAIAVEDNIYIFETVGFTQILVCRGHVSNVEALAFQPGNRKVLVSSAEDYRRGSPPSDPTIIVWDLNKLGAHPMMESSAILNIASQATETVVKNLAQVPIGLSAPEVEGLTSAIEPLISRTLKLHNLASQISLTGRLTSGFQSEFFSPSGNYLIYLPGQRFHSPTRNDIKIYSMSTHEDILTLKGHSDSLMWTGYSPDESMIATVAWDKSMRIWDAGSGQQKYKFDTNGQNWTGGFSPDSQRFAGTCGDGSLYIYSLEDGSMLVHHKPETRSAWMRALSWSANGKVVAVGSAHRGRLILYDVERKEVTQERILSTELTVGRPEIRGFIGRFLECYAVRFVDGGRKVVVLTSGGGGIETFDLETWEKWRFARPGIDPVLQEGNNQSDENEDIASKDINKGQEEEKESRVRERGGHNMTVWEDEKESRVRERGGYNMTVWEDEKRGTVWIASIDGDAVRIWDLPMTGNAT